MRITTTTNKGIEKNVMHVGVKIEYAFDDDCFRAAHYTAILRAMRDTDKDSFYKAMSDFVDETELKNAVVWISKHCEGMRRW